MSDGHKHRALLVTARNDSGLLGSYGRALERLGVDTHYWDLAPALNRAVRLGPFGRRLNSFVPIDPWQSRASRELVVAAMQHQPDVLFVCGVTRIVPGALAQVRAALPRARLVLVWPDTLLNLTSDIVQALPLYDLVATYGEGSVDPLRRMGARDVRWVPLAADCALMPANIAVTDEQRRRFSCDVAFIGNPRPERERAILALVDAGIDVKVWGTDSWVRKTASPKRARRYWQGEPLYGNDFARATRSARVSLNVIDDTNYPAANMRFFEALACGATALVSSCPEMEPLFPDDVAVVYFRSDLDLVVRARELLKDGERRQRIAEEGHSRVLGHHTYEHRVRSIFEALNLPLT
jgi:hypothetical protein